MAWSKANLPKRGGSYSRFVVQRQKVIPASTRGTVGLAFTHSWGPLKQFVHVNSLAEWMDIYGQGGDPANNINTAGFLAAYNVFRGEDDDFPGAGTVVAYRVGGATAAKATKSISNTTPAAALRLDAVYEGTFGNSISYSVEANAADPTGKNDLVIFVNGTEVNRYPHAKADLASLAAAVNKNPHYVRATVLLDGTPLGAATASSLTGGNDGTTLAAGDWTAAMSAFETQAFDVFVPANLTDSSIQASLDTWTADKNGAERAKRFTTVSGGAVNEALAAAITRAAAASNENIATLGVGSYRDTALGIVMSTAQLAPRMAGVIAARGFTASIFCAHLADLEIVTGPSDSDILDAVDAGVVVLGQDSVGVRFEDARTTYTADTDDKPLDTFGQIKYVYTMQQFENIVRQRQESGQVIGRLVVNDDTREHLVGDAQAILNDFARQGAVQANPLVKIASDPPPDDDQDFVAIDWVAKFGRSLDMVLNTFYLS
jgi:hypothetical protein